MHDFPPRVLEQGRSPGLRFIEPLAAFPEYSPVALCVPAVALCAYSYGVVADLHRASRHLAVSGWLQAERFSSRMKLFREILQCIDGNWTGKVDPVVHVVDVVFFDRHHTAPTWTVLQYLQRGLAAAHQQQRIGRTLELYLHADLRPFRGQIVGHRTSSRCFDDLRDKGVLANGCDWVIPDR